MPGGFLSCWWSCPRDTWDSLLLLNSTYLKAGSKCIPSRQGWVQAYHLLNMPRSQTSLIKHIVLWETCLFICTPNISFFANLTYHRELHCISFIRDAPREKAAICSIFVPNQRPSRFVWQFDKTGWENIKTSEHPIPSLILFIFQKLAANLHIFMIIS